ncbi:hypothetical protein ACDX78_16390 [Virgibacillus oceani]
MSIKVILQQENRPGVARKVYFYKAHRTIVQAVKQVYRNTKVSALIM